MVFDPLDGSSNIDAGISVGSIFGIYEPQEECALDSMEDAQKMMVGCWALRECVQSNDMMSDSGGGYA